MCLARATLRLDFLKREKEGSLKGLLERLPHDVGLRNVVCERSFMIA